MGPPVSALQGTPAASAARTLPLSESAQTSGNRVRLHRRVRLFRQLHESRAAGGRADARVRLQQRPGGISDHRHFPDSRRHADSRRLSCRPLRFPAHAPHRLAVGRGGEFSDGRRRRLLAIAFLQDFHGHGDWHLFRGRRALYSRRVRGPAAECRAGIFRRFHPTRRRICDFRGAADLQAGRMARDISSFRRNGADRSRHLDCQIAARGISTLASRKIPSTCSSLPSFGFWDFFKWPPSAFPWLWVRGWSFF